VADLIGVYNPDDEELEYRFDSRIYHLKAEDITMVPRKSLGPLLNQLSGMGATPVPLGISKSDLSQLAQAAKKRWADGKRKWAEDVLLTSAKVNKERTELGISPIEGPKVEQAREWLRKHGFLK
jgi:hypothetical protein